MFDEASRSPEPSCRPISVSDLERALVALAGELGRARARPRPARAAPARARRLRSRTRTTRGGRGRVQQPRHAGPSDDHHVAELGAGPDPAAVGAPAEDQPAADAGAEREHDHVARAPPGAARATRRSRLRSRRCRSATGSPNRARHRVAERHARRAGCSPSRARRRSRWSICDGMPKPTAATLSSEQLARPRLEPVEKRVLDSDRRRRLSCGARPCPSRVDEAGEDLRPADVDTDDAGCGHGRRLP